MATRKCIFFLPVLSLVLFSCGSTKEVAYFKNIPDKAYESQIEAVEAPYQPGDILSIHISSPDPEASALFNSNNVNVSRSSTVTGSQTEAGGYLVNTEGNIQLPILGSMKAGGFTKSQLKKNIVNLILSKKLLVDPVVEIRHMNFEVTVLGEVDKPTVITVPSERISLVKALGLAGDLTIYGKRTNILLIREEEGKRVTKHIDINSPHFISSPYYYLKPNDVIYVEPNNAKVASASRVQQVLPFVIAGLSAAIIVLDRVLK